MRHKLNKLIIKLLCPVKIGDYCDWIGTNGVSVWGEYRRIVWIERYGKTKFFAFTNGSMTGIPVEQLIKEKKGKKST